MNNHDFNIINQLVEDQKSLWRIENHYINESRDDDEREAWKKLYDQKKASTQQLQEMAKRCL